MASAAVEMLTLSHCRKMIVFNTDLALDFDTDTEPLSTVNGAQRKRVLSETEDDQEKGLHVKKRRKQSKPVRIASESLSDGEPHIGNENPDNNRPLVNIGTEGTYSSDNCTKSEISNDHDLKAKPCNELKLMSDRSRDHQQLFTNSFDDCAMLPINLTNTKLLSGYNNTSITQSNPIHSQPSEKTRHINESTFASFHEPCFEGSTGSPISLPSVKASSNSVHALNSSHQSGSPLRIFNPEAFCDLCNKEFCNKYFLKTHKANKHGIYSENIGSNLLDSLPSLPYINYYSGAGELLPANSQISRSILRKSQLSVSLSQQNGVLLQKNAATTNGNSRAFCNICQREFCNKYFVRRHKAKIHGIVDSSFPDTPPGTNEGYDQKSFNSNDIRSYVENHEKSDDHEIYSTFSGLSIVPTLETDIHENRFSDRKACSSMTDRQDPLRQTEDIDSDECISPRIPKSVSPTSMTPIHQLDVIDKETDSIDKTIKRLGITNSEAFCDICRKEYCNKYFLKTHKMRSHGIAQTEWEKREDKASNQSVPLNLIIGDQTVDKVDDSSDVEIDVDTFCKVCGQKFRDQFLLKIHLSYVHPQPMTSDVETVLKLKQRIPVIRNSGSGEATVAVATDDGHHLRHGPPSISICDTGKRKLVDAVSLETDIQAAALPNDNAESSFASKEAKHHCPSCHRQFSYTALLEEHIVECHGASVQHTQTDIVNTTTETTSVNDIEQSSDLQGAEVQIAPTSSFCEICKKELCNKYFMKTHMQRMHGISIDNGAHIGGVVCDICNKELCSKYFLRVHKQNSHGIVDEILGLDTSRIQCPGVDPSLKPSEQSDLGNRYFSHFTEVCAICSRRFRSMKWLKAHLLNDHGDQGKEKWKEFRAHYQLGQPNGFSQEIYTSESAGITNFTTTNNYNKGFVQKESIENQNGSVFSAIFNGKNTNTKQYHCSYCPFATSILAFLFVHERSHTKGSDSFDTGESYEKHCVSHSMSEATDSTSSGSDPNQREKLNKSVVSESINRTVAESKPDDSQVPSACCFNTKQYDMTVEHEVCEGESVLVEPISERLKKDLAAYESQTRDFESDHEINVALIQAKQLLELIADKTDIPVSFSLPQSCQKRAIMQPFVLEHSGQISLTDVEKAVFKKSFLSSIVFLPVTERLKNPVTVSFKLTPTL